MRSFKSSPQSPSKKQILLKLPPFVEMKPNPWTYDFEHHGTIIDHLAKNMSGGVSTVREKNIFSRSGNFEICQGIREFKQKSGNYEVTSL